MERDRRLGAPTVVAVLVGLCALAGCSNSPGAAEGGNQAPRPPRPRRPPRLCHRRRTLRRPRLQWPLPRCCRHTEQLGLRSNTRKRMPIRSIRPSRRRWSIRCSTKSRATSWRTTKRAKSHAGASNSVPHVVSVSATRATVEDCSFSSDFLVYKKTGKQVPPVAKPEHDGVLATLVLDGSTWKVEQRVITEGSCPAGY